MKFGKGYTNMPLTIKNREIERLVRELSEMTEETMTEAIAQALKERLERESKRLKGKQIRDEIERI